MSNQRPSFAKREREMRLKDKARQKAERREARRANPSAQKGPPIATDDPMHVPSEQNGVNSLSSVTSRNAVNGMNGSMNGSARDAVTDAPPASAAIRPRTP